jgi:hypothetical protein
MRAWCQNEASDQSTGDRNRVRKASFQCHFNIRGETMGKGSEKVRTNAKKNKLREKAKRLISEGKKLTGELVRYDPRHKKAT